LRIETPRFRTNANVCQLLRQRNAFEDENKTIGIVLAQNKSDLVVEYTLPENNEQIFCQ
jgi:hypothetical protein